MPKLKMRACDRCGRRLSYPKWIKSRHTDHYYCTDLNGCANRAAKKNRRRPSGT